MTETTKPPPDLPSRRPSQDVRPTALQAVITLVGGLVLAAGSCAGFLGTLNFNRDSTVNVGFALGFFASLIAAGVGLVLVIVRQVKLMNRRRASALRATGTAGAVVPDALTPLPASGGRAWKAVLLGAALLAAAVAFVVLLIATDPNPIAIVFLLLAAASGLGSIVSLVVGVIRYGQGR